MSKSAYAGRMTGQMFERFSESPEARERMDGEVRRDFKVPEDRYFTVTLPPGTPGAVFIDRSRKRPSVVHKLSKSDTP